MEMINVSGYVAQEKLAIAEVGGARGLEGRAQDQIWFSVVPYACWVLGRGLRHIVGALWSCSSL